VSARGRQRGSPNRSNRELDLPRSTGPSQELVDARAEAEIAHLEAQIELIEARTARIWLGLLLAALLPAIVLISGAVDPGSLAGGGYDLVADKAWFLPRLL